MNYVTALVQLPLVRETGKEQIRNPEDVARVCADLSELAQEALHVLILSTKHCLINRQMVTLGLADASLAHAREVFRPAIEAGAAIGIILVHGHPSGDPTPSAEDIKITKKLIEAGRILDIAVQDHVIIGKATESSKGFFSMRQAGLCDFGAA